MHANSRGNRPALCHTESRVVRGDIQGYYQLEPNVAGAYNTM
jgi:hypothetical protein